MVAHVGARCDTRWPCGHPPLFVPRHGVDETASGFGVPTGTTPLPSVDETRGPRLDQDDTGPGEVPAGPARREGNHTRSGTGLPASRMAARTGTSVSSAKPTTKNTISDTIESR